MTCIAAFRVGKKGCIMAADRRAASPGVGSWFGETAEPKVHVRQVGDEKIMYGCRGAVTFGSVMDCIEWPARDGMDTHEYISKKILPLIRAGMEASKYDPAKSHYSGVLLCIGSDVISIDHGCGLVFHKDTFTALGDGASAAYAAFDMREALTGKTKGADGGMTALRHVLRIVAKRNWSCDDNIDIFMNF